MRLFAPWPSSREAVDPSDPFVSEIGIVLSDFGTVILFFNNLVALFFTKNVFRSLYLPISNLGFQLGHLVPGRWKPLAGARSLASISAPTFR